MPRSHNTLSALISTTTVVLIALCFFPTTSCTPLLRVAEAKVAAAAVHVRPPSTAVCPNFIPAATGVFTEIVGRDEERVGYGWTVSPTHRTTAAPDGFSPCPAAGFISRFSPIEKIEGGGRDSVSPSAAATASDSTCLMSVTGNATAVEVVEDVCRYKFIFDDLKQRLRTFISVELRCDAASEALVLHPTVTFREAHTVHYVTLRGNYSGVCGKN